MSTNKPRICEVLGVEVGEVFQINHPDVDKCEFLANKYGTLLCDGEISDHGIYIAINQPDLIIRKPRFTEDEVDVLKALYGVGARYLARGKHLRWYRWRPYLRVEDDKWDMRGDWGTGSGKLPAKLSPSLLPGQSIELSSITKEDA